MCRTAENKPQFTSCR